MNIYELDKLATPRPWISDSRGGLPNWLMPDREMGGMRSTAEERANAKLAAHCRNNFLRMLDELKEEHELRFPREDEFHVPSLCSTCKLIKEMEDVKVTIGS